MSQIDRGSDSDLARILRALLDGIEPEMEPRQGPGRGRRGFTEITRARLPVDLVRELRKKCRRDEINRATDFSTHVERAIRLYMRVLDLAKAPGMSTR